MEKSKMLNKFIQGSAADISKFNMLKCCEEVAKTRATKFIDINFNEPDNYGSPKEIGYFSYYAGFLAGFEAGRQQQSGIGWIDTAHIEIKLHDVVESIKKQLDAMLQEILGGNDKEVEK